MTHAKNRCACVWAPSSGGGASVGAGGLQPRFLVSSTGSASRLFPQTSTFHLPKQGAARGDVPRIHHPRLLRRHRQHGGLPAWSVRCLAASAAVPALPESVACMPSPIDCASCLAASPSPHPLLSAPSLLQPPSSVAHHRVRAVAAAREGAAAGLQELRRRVDGLQGAPLRYPQGAVVGCWPC